MLVYPVVDRRMITESVKNYIDTPVWDGRLTAFMWDVYLNGATENIQYASPIEAESLKCFPKSYIEVAEFDSLRDEGIAFAKRLEQEGVEVSFHEVKRGCHGFESALDSKIMKDAMERRVNWIRRQM